MNWLSEDVKRRPAPPLKLEDFIAPAIIVASLLAFIYLCVRSATTVPVLKNEVCVTEVPGGIKIIDCPWEQH